MPRRKRIQSPDLTLRWRIALAHAEVSEAEWARAEGLSVAQLRRVVAGDSGGRWRPLVEAFIRAREAQLVKDLKVFAIEDRRRAKEAAKTVAA